MSLTQLMEGLFGWKILAEAKESNAMVVKRRNEKILLSHNVIYSKLRDGSLYTHSYWDYFIPLPSLYSRPRILIIGLGGGTIPYQINRLFGPSAEIDIVELDRNMLRLVDAFLPEKLHANIIIEDGYSYVQRFKGTYDIIMMDPFIRDNIPDQFFEQRFIDGASEALKPDGVLAINYVFSATGMVRQHEFKSRLGKRFRVYTVNYSLASGNRIFICSKSMAKEEMIGRIGRNFPKDRENAFILRAYRKMG